MDLGSLVRRLVPGAGSSRARDGSDAGSPGVPAVPGSEGAPAGSAPAAVTAGEWRSLPPIQRTAGAAPLVAPNAPFRDGLATTQPAPVALATLGHERRLEAPAGLATGIATPVQRAPAEPLPSSVRRSESHPSPGGGRAGRTPRSDGTVDGSSPGSVIDADGEAVGPAALEPPRPGPGPLVTSPPVGPQPTGLVGTAAVSRAAAVQRPPSGAIPSAVAGATTPAAVPDAVPNVVRSDAESRPVGTAPVAGMPPLVARRVRLGPPMPAPVAETVRHLDAPAAQRAVANVDTAGDPADAGAVSGSAPRSAPDASPDTSVTPAKSPLAPVPEGPAVPAPPTVPLRIPTVARAAMAPLVGRLQPAADTRPPITVARRAGEPPAAAPDDTDGPSGALAALARIDPFGVANRAPTSGGETRAPGPSDALAAIPGRGSGPAPVSGFAGPGGIAAMPTVARAAGPWATQPMEAGTRLTWANPWVPSATQGTVPPNPAVSEPGVQAAGRPPDGPFVPRPRGGRVGPAIQRQTDDPGDRRTSPEAPGATTISPGGPVTTTWAGGPASSALPLAARLTDPGASPAESPPVQRAEASAAAAEPAGGSAAAGAAPGAPGSPTAEKELDDLARRLYDRIGLRLRRDLLVERERAGALVDRGF